MRYISITRFLKKEKGRAWEASLEFSSAGGRQLEMQVGGVRLGTVNGSAPCRMAAQVISLSLVGFGLTGPILVARTCPRSQQGAAEGSADHGPVPGGVVPRIHLPPASAPFFAPLGAHGVHTAAQTPKHGRLPPSVSLRQAADPAP